MTAFNVPTAIIGVGGKGREDATATVVQRAYFNGGRWPQNIILGLIDATPETGRAGEGFRAHLPTPSSNRYFVEYLPDTNVRGIAEDTGNGNPEAQRPFQIVPRDILVAAPQSSAAIGGFQRPAVGTVLAILYQDRIDAFVKAIVAELKKMAGGGPAWIDVVGGANGAIGASFGAAISRRVRESSSAEGNWRVAFHLAAVTPDGRTPDANTAAAIFYTGLKDLAISARRG